MISPGNPAEAFSPLHQFECFSLEKFKRFTVASVVEPFSCFLLEPLTCFKVELLKHVERLICCTLLPFHRFAVSRVLTFNG
jgi:hypothetical protein